MHFKVRYNYIDQWGEPTESEYVTTGASPEDVRAHHEQFQSENKDHELYVEQKIISIEKDSSYLWTTIMANGSKEWDKVREILDPHLLPNQNAKPSEVPQWTLHFDRGGVLFRIHPYQKQAACSALLAAGYELIEHD